MHISFPTECPVAKYSLPLTMHSASLLASTHLSALISRTARDLEDTIVLLLSSSAKRLRLAREIAAAVSAAKRSASGSFVDHDGGASGASLNAVLRLAHEAAMLGHARVVVSEGDQVIRS